MLISMNNALVHIILMASGPLLVECVRCIQDNLILIITIYFTIRVPYSIQSSTYAISIQYRCSEGNCGGGGVGGRGRRSSCGVVNALSLQELGILKYYIMTRLQPFFVMFPPLFDSPWWCRLLIFALNTILTRGRECYYIFKLVTLRGHSLL